jgi:membrane-bound serine protease (ClpP class)
MGPNTAFCLVIFGVLGIYCEFIWPGRVWQGVAGAAAAVTGAYFLWRLKPLAIGLELLALAAVLLILDAFVETCWIAGLTGTIAIVFGLENSCRERTEFTWR